MKKETRSNRYVYRRLDRRQAGRRTGSRQCNQFRTPYQSNKDLRALLNSHGAQYYDMHLSELAQSLRYGFLGKIDVAIVEAADVTEDGEIVPTSGVGILPTICGMADRIIAN